MRMETREKSLDKIYKRRSRIEIPDYQRGEVWNKTKKQLFIDSLLNGWHVPKLNYPEHGGSGIFCPLNLPKIEKA